MVDLRRGHFCPMGKKPMGRYNIGDSIADASSRRHVTCMEFICIQQRSEFFLGPVFQLASLRFFFFQRGRRRGYDLGNSDFDLAQDRT